MPRPWSLPGITASHCSAGSQGLRADSIHAYYSMNRNPASDCSLCISTSCTCTGIILVQHTQLSRQSAATESAKHPNYVIQPHSCCAAQVVVTGQLVSGSRNRNVTWDLPTWNCIKHTCSAIKCIACWSLNVGSWSTAQTLQFDLQGHFTVPCSDYISVQVLLCMGGG